MVGEQVCTQTQKLENENIRTEVLSSYPQFAELRPEWDSMVQAAAIENPFLSHAWLSTWWESFGAGKQLHIITVWSGNQLFAAAPMMIVQCRMYGLKLIRLDSLYNFHTPRYDFIIGARPDIAYPAIWRQLSSSPAPWDVVTLAQVPNESSTISKIERLAAQDGWNTGRWSPPPSPVIRLDCTFDSFFGRLKGGYRYNLRKRYEKLCKLGSVDMEVVTDRNAVRQAMEADGFRLEAAAWKGRGGTAMNSDPDVADFYLRLAERAADLEWLRLTFLRVNGKRIALDYVLRDGRTLYGVKIGYDPEYHTYSPGNMLLKMILQEACANGVTAYDFLGVDDEWKSDWTKECRQHSWLFLFRNSLRGRLLYRAKFDVIPRARGLVSSAASVYSNKGRVLESCRRFWNTGIQSNH